MKKLIVVGASAAALAVSTGAASASASASATQHSCGHEGTAVGRILARNVRCPTARKLVRVTMQGRSYKKFKCSARKYSGGATVTCRHGRQKVTFHVAG